MIFLFFHCIYKLKLISSNSLNRSFSVRRTYIARFEECIVVNERYLRYLYVRNRKLPQNLIALLIPDII